MRQGASAKSRSGGARPQPAAAPADVCRRPLRARLACGCVELILLFFVAVLISPIQRSSVSDSHRPAAGLRRNFALPPSDTSRLSAIAWVMQEDRAATLREEDNEDDDDPSSAMREAYDGEDPSLSPARSAPALSLAAPGRPLSALHPLRC